MNAQGPQGNMNADRSPSEGGKMKNNEGKEAMGPKMDGSIASTGGERDEID